MDRHGIYPLLGDFSVGSKMHPLELVFEAIELMVFSGWFGVSFFG